MKIGIDCRMYRSSIAGIGRYSQNLVKNLLELDHENEYVLFMTKEDAEEYSKNHQKSSKVKIVIVEVAHYSIGEQTKFGSIIAQEQLDLVHFLNFNYPVNYKGKFVVTVHDLTLLFFPGMARSTNFIKRKAFYYVMKKACFRSNIVIVDAQSTKKDIINVFNTPSEKIRVIYLAADENKFVNTNDKKINLQKKYNLTKPVILYVGQFRKHKNLDRLIQSFEILNKDLPATLVLIGGRLSENVQNKNIIIPGFVSDEELLAWYKEASVFVFPSLYEGFGLPGLEAMQVGTPVAASNVSSLPEIYKDAAIYFDPLKPEEIADKMKEIIQNEKLRQELIKKGKVIAKEYSWQKTAKETLKIYKEVTK